MLAQGSDIEAGFGILNFLFLPLFASKMQKKNNLQPFRFISSRLKLLFPTLNMYHSRCLHWQLNSFCG